MEKRVNGKIENYVVNFKQEIANKIKSVNFDNQSLQSELLEYIFDYDRLCLTKEDFIKRKRIKNAIPTSNRCSAKRANGEQCTRRRRIIVTFAARMKRDDPMDSLIREEK